MQKCYYIFIEGLTATIYAIMSSSCSDRPTELRKSAGFEFLYKASFLSFFLFCHFVFYVNRCSTMNALQERMKLGSIIPFYLYNTHPFSFSDCPRFWKSNNSMIVLFLSFLKSL